MSSRIVLSRQTLGGVSVILLRRTCGKQARRPKAELEIASRIVPVKHRHTKLIQSWLAGDVPDGVFLDWLKVHYPVDQLLGN